MTSKYSLSESVASTPVDLEISDEQLTDLLASPLFPQEREASADRSHVCHTQRENLVSDLVSDSFRLQTSAKRPVASKLFGSEREFRSIQEEQRQQLLSEACSEIYCRIVWNLATPTRSHEENELHCTKKCLHKNKHCEKLVFEEFRKWGN